MEVPFRIVGGCLKCFVRTVWKKAGVPVRTFAEILLFDKEIRLFNERSAYLGIGFQVFEERCGTGLHCPDDDEAWEHKMVSGLSLVSV